MRPTAITLDKTGARRYTKVSYPIRYGRYTEIRTPHYTYQFNLKGEIKFIQGRDSQWPSPLEWLKRTQGNDWVYYLAGDYSGVRDAFGEYYLPCPDYPTNSFIARDPFEEDPVRQAIATWQQEQVILSHRMDNGWDAASRQYINYIGSRTPDILEQQTRRFHEIIGGRISVLPPDTRNVDYEVIPVVIADGCLYQCDFCRVKSNRRFQPRTRQNIVDQIKALSRFYGDDLRNYNAVFLGMHDALAVDPEQILFAAQSAYERFDLNSSYLEGTNLFLFGSVDALLNKKKPFFDALQSLPYSTHINIGFESADPETLRLLKKPIDAKMVEKAFTKMQTINRQYSDIEITANFVYGDHLPTDHLHAFFDMAKRLATKPHTKGTIYFSPLLENGTKAKTSGPTNRIRHFYRTKAQTPLSCYLYLIQRL